MTDLHTRLLNAEEGSRELSDEVLLTLGWWKDTKRTPTYPVQWVDLKGGGWDDGTQPNPTQNSHDAVSLMPDGWYAGIDPRFFFEDDNAKWVVYDAILCRPRWTDWVPINSDWIDRVEARAKTPALAVCAALMAMQEKTDPKAG